MANRRMAEVAEDEFVARILTRRLRYESLPALHDRPSFGRLAAVRHLANVRRPLGNFCAPSYGGELATGGNSGVSSACRAHVLASSSIFKRTDTLRVVRRPFRTPISGWKLHEASGLGGR